MFAHSLNAYCIADNNAHSGPSHFLDEHDTLRSAGRFFLRSLFLNAVPVLSLSRRGLLYSYLTPSSEGSLAKRHAGLLDQFCTRIGQRRGATRARAVVVGQGGGRLRFRAAPSPLFCVTDSAPPGSRIAGTWSNAAK